MNIGSPNHIGTLKHFSHATRSSFVAGSIDRVTRQARNSIWVGRFLQQRMGIFSNAMNADEQIGRSKTTLEQI